MPCFDSHAHLTAPSVYPHLTEVLKRAAKAGVSHILNICTDLDTLEKGLSIQNAPLSIYHAGATTPHDVEKEGEQYFSHFERAAREKRLVAIGETGLDYHYEHSPKELQKQFLVRYLHLAASLKLPVIFHCRDAFEDLFSIVDQEYPKNKPAVLHCFTGNVQEAEEVLKRGWHLSLSGIVTFKRSEELREVAKMTPLSQLLIETDTPYLAPQTKRGQINEPSFIFETAQTIASVQGVPLQQVLKQTSQNALKLFCLG
jgi:TatD DNase family protein